MNNVKKVKVIEPINLVGETGESTRKLKVCAYCRVSSDHEDQKLSFDAQRSHFESSILANPEWDYAGIYADYGISGKSKKNRTEFLRMIDDAKSHRIDLIVTKSISRFARNTVDCIEAVRELKLHGVGVYFEKENINTLSVESELILTILSSIAEEELMSLSQNIRWSNQKRMRQGKVQIVTQRFMGYDKDKKGNLIINEEQAKIVRYIFDLYMSGLGVIPIAVRLTNEGILNISGNSQWSYSVVNSMLKNEKYCGDVIMQKTITADTLTFRRKKNEGEEPMAYIRDNHEPIIDRATFERVQNLIRERAMSKGYKKEMAWKYQTRYPFTQKIYCGQCGRAFIHSIHNSTSCRSEFWACSTYVDRRKVECDMKPIKDDTVRRLFVRLFNKLFTNKKILRSYMNTLQVMGAARIATEHIKELDAQLDLLLKEERVLFSVSEKGYLAKDLFVSSHDELIDKIETLRTERSKAIAEINGQDKRLDVSREISNMLDKRMMPMNTFEEDVFEQMVEKVMVITRENLVFHLKNGMTLSENYTFKRGKDEV